MNGSGSAVPRPQARRIEHRAVLLLLLLVACGDRDATPELRDPGSPEAVQRPATPAPPTDAPPTTPSGDPALEGGLPPGVTAQMVQEGNRVYHQQGICYTCHGPNGEGTPLGPRLNDQDWLLITGRYEEIMDIVRTGVPNPVQYPAPMPPMGGASLSDAQLRAVAAYIFALTRGVGEITPAPATGAR
jgi:mono/diheme cytochrome c family protein